MRALQALDRGLGPAASFLLKPLALLRRSSAAHTERLLVIKFWGLGSLQLATPAIQALRRRHPGAHIELLTLAGNRDLALGFGLYDKVRYLDLNGCGKRALVGRLVRMLRELRSARYARVYDFEFFTWFSVIASVCSGAPRTFGFAAAGARRGGLHTDTVPFNRYWHVARNFRALAGGENGCDVTSEELSIYQVTKSHELELEAVLKPDPRPLVVLNPNAGDLAPERRWPADRFAALASRLIREEGARVVLTGTHDERAVASEVLSAAGPLPAGRLLDLSGALSIGGLHALFRRAALVVSNDSGPMHLAAAQGAPTLGLFGPETPVMYAPLGKRTRVHYAPPLCSPCINVHDAKVLSCIHGQPECLMRIEVEQVLSSARALLREAQLEEEEATACASSS
jgi:lipopolysaccharide heptosyltransferase II